MIEPRLSLVIPTLNEEGNIGELIRRVEASLGDVDHEVIVVDDDSQDGTRAAARSAASDVRIIHRREAHGLSSAVLDGFQAARGELVCVMDADLQHPPETVKEMLREAEGSSVDLVVGSRYAPSGEVEGFPRRRRLVSWVARTLAIAASPTVRAHGIQDPVSGFFLVRRSVLELDAIEPRGYKILLDILHTCRIREAREVGISFHGRYTGESNVTLATGLSYLRQLAAIAAHSPANRRFAKFTLVGTIGLAVNLSLLAGLTEVVGLPYLVSATIAIEASILSNFSLNDVWTFHDRRRGSWLHRLTRFNAVSLGAMFVNLLVLSLLVEGFGLHYLWAEVAAVGVGSLANDTGNLSWNYVTSEEHRRLPWMH